MRDVYLAIDIMITVGLLSLAVVSLVKRGYDSSINRLFAAFSCSVALWIFSNHISNDIQMPKEIVLYANYFVFAASFASAILPMQFIAKLASAHKLELFMKKALAPLWIICALCFSPLMVSDISIQGNVYAVEFGPFVWLYIVGLIFIVSVITYGILHGLKYAKGVKRRQLMAISIGMAISLPLVIVLSFIIPLITGSFAVTEFGITPLIILVFCFYYGVVKYQLFDIRRAAVRTGAYVLSLVTLSVIYYLAAYVISFVMFKDDVETSAVVNPMNVFLALVLAFIFQPIKKFFDKVTNKIFYRDSYDSDVFFARLNRTLTFTTDLRGLLERAAEEVGSTLKSEQAFFFINTFDGHYVTAGTTRHKQLPRSDADLLDDVYSKNNSEGVISASLLETNDPIRRLMYSHRIELILPLNQAGKIIGYLCLGDHQNSGYTMRDMRVLSTIADELGIAIQNALSIQEVKDLNENLQQRISEATRELRNSNNQLQRLDKAKDEFVSMASHQLRTPLTSVKGYISMILDGDVGDVNDQQRHMLDEAFMSSERMVHLINDFLNMSRIQTGKFLIEKTDVDLAKVVKQEIDSLRPSALARGLNFVYHAPKHCPILNLDESKIRQVIMNFADNAIFYSKPDTDIIVKLTVDENRVTFTVKDHGIGVPITERAQLFTKFYRASNARKQRPDGTGVGLYLAKRVIDAHKGEIVFESAEGKGSTFGFILPIKQN